MYSLTEETNTTGCGSERVLKTTVTEEHSYIYAGGKLLRETITTTAANGTVTTKILDFAYDAQGTPYSLTYTNGTASPATYYYITNLQGDVTQLIDSTGKEAASYSYDPYGKVMSARGAMAETNPAAVPWVLLRCRHGVSIISRAGIMMPMSAGLSMRTVTRARGRASWAAICLHIVEITLQTELIWVDMQMKLPKKKRVKTWKTC